MWLLLAAIVIDVLCRLDSYFFLFFVCACVGARRNHLEANHILWILLFSVNFGIVVVVKIDNGRQQRKRNTFKKKISTLTLVDTSVIPRTTLMYQIAIISGVCLYFFVGDFLRLSRDRKKWNDERFKSNKTHTVDWHISVFIISNYLRCLRVYACLSRSPSCYHFGIRFSLVWPKEKTNTSHLLATLQKKSEPKKRYRSERVKL